MAVIKTTSEHVDERVSVELYYNGYYNIGNKLGDIVSCVITRGTLPSGQYNFGNYLASSIEITMQYIPRINDEYDQPEFFEIHIFETGNPSNFHIVYREYYIYSMETLDNGLYKYVLYNNIQRKLNNSTLFADNLPTNLKLYDVLHATNLQCGSPAFDGFQVDKCFNFIQYNQYFGKLPARTDGKGLSEFTPLEIMKSIAERTGRNLFDDGHKLYLYKPLEVETTYNETDEYWNTEPYYIDKETYIYMDGVGTPSGNANVMQPFDNITLDTCTIDSGTNPYTVNRTITKQCTGYTTKHRTLSINSDIMATSDLNMLEAEMYGNRYVTYIDSNGNQVEYDLFSQGMALGASGFWGHWRDPKWKRYYANEIQMHGNIWLDLTLIYQITNTSAYGQIGKIVTTIDGGMKHQVSFYANLPNDGIAIKMTTYGKKTQSVIGTPGTAAGFSSPTISVTELAETEAPTATVEATGVDQAKAFSFSFGIPKGNTGATGSKGDKGDKGDVGYLDDTGWVVVGDSFYPTYIAKDTTFYNYLMYRKIGNIVYLKGRLKYTGNTTSSQLAIIWLPQDARSTVYFNDICCLSGGANAMLFLNAYRDSLDIFGETNMSNGTTIYIDLCYTSN